MSERSKRYRAFISYSQKDKAHARRVHRALERYRLPRGVQAEGVDTKTRKLGRFFRDDEEMGAATDLGAALQGAIADAENLIVVCSPNAGQSQWVNEEILHFKRTGRAERIFAIIVSGEPTPPANQQDRECFPPALRFELGPDGSLTDRPAEPLGLDVRKEPFNRLVVRLAAGIVHTPFDTLWKREQRRARAKAATAALAAVLLLLIVGSAATQNLWRPRLDAYMHYTRFAHSNAELLSATPGTTFQDCRESSTDCPTMVIIPEGTFLMGSTVDDVEARAEERPQHEVIVRRLAVSQTEITVAQWQACIMSGGCAGYVPNDVASDNSDARPVVDVSWYDARSYVQWLSQVTGSDYRLLSEAEWEYSARAGSNAQFAWAMILRCAIPWR